MEKRKNWLVLCLTAGFLLVFALWTRRPFPMLNLTAFGGAEISLQKSTLRSNTENSPAEARKG